MAELQERYRHWDEREGLVTLGHLTMHESRLALQRSLTTMHDALRLFDAVVDALGDRGWLDPEGGEQRRRLLVRDAEHTEWVVPTALVEHCWAGTRGEHQLGPVMINPDAVLPIDAPDDYKPGDPWFRERDPEPEVYPHGPDMRAGDLQLSEGPRHWRVKYDDRGLKYEYLVTAGDSFTWIRYDTVRPYAHDPLARPPDVPPISLLCRPDLDPRGHGTEALAHMVAEMDPGGEVLARVRLPLPIPGGAEGAWTRARWAMRTALWEGRVPPEARFVVADGFDGSALAWGVSREEALEAWEAEVHRVKPKPPGWKPEPEPELPDIEPERPRRIEDDEGKLRGFSTGTMTLVAPAVGELAWPMPLPRFTPAVLVPLPPLPATIPAHLAAAGFRRWMRIVGDFGEVGFGLVRDESGGGFTLMGDGVLDLIDDADALLVELDASDEREQASCAEMAAHGMPNPWTDSEYPCRTVSYRLWDDGHRKRVPAKQAGARWTQEFVARDVGIGWRWLVSRMRHV